MPSPRSSKRFDLMYGNTSVMIRLYEQIQKVAATDATVLLVGESGTGKELVAKAIHQESQRARAPFVAVNCGALPAGLIESALFGHEKGSFTGAGKQHAGYFEHVSGGTLFLDEITEMPVDMQVKLLRVLENGCFVRVGGNEEVHVDGRVIAATNRDLENAVSEGHLRQDLMYRLAVFPLRIPPLREREDDIELLAQAFLQELNALHHTRKTLSRRSYEAIRTYPWPGNVRELKNVVRRAYILAADTLEVAECIASPADVRRIPQQGCLNFFVGTPLADAQRDTILATLQHFGGNKRLAAKTLGISLKTLYNRLKEY